MPETTSADVETISAGQEVLAYIIRSGENLERTTFVTPDECKQQVGFVVHPAGAEIQRHRHLPLERHLTGTSEVLVVRSGRCEMDVYDGENEFLCTRELQTGDVMVMIGGGHGFRMNEDTVLLEIKQGPYFGRDEKEYF